jgi:opacity protein-like surface antigen
MKKLFFASVVLAVINAGGSALAADIPLKAPAPAAPYVPRWDGLYASFSAGGTWTKAEQTFRENSTDESVFEQFDPAGALEARGISTQTGSRDESVSGKGGGAVFTFAMGYNVVWSSWLVGIQSEVSLNRNNIRLAGTQDSRSRAINQTVFPIVSPPSFDDFTNVFDIKFNLENKWTISEMARFGFLPTPDLLVYGLVGWSWGGFEAFQGDIPFTLNGFTWGVGVEKDFGWLRAFVQYKGIRYKGKDVDVSNPGFNQSRSTNEDGSVRIFTTTNTDAATRRFSADVAEVTAGVTIPINFRRW